MPKTAEELELELKLLKLKLEKMELEQKSAPKIAKKPKEKKVWSRVLKGNVIPSTMTGETLPKIRIEVDIQTVTGKVRLRIGKETSPWFDTQHDEQIISYEFQNGETWYYDLKKGIPYRVFYPKIESFKINRENV